MLTSDLFRRVLIQPVEDGADELLIVSGYASPLMVMWHMSELLELGYDIPISLIVGMTPASRGVNKIQHKDFQKLTKGSKGVAVDGTKYRGPFACNYLVKGNPCHAKVYIWLKNGKPVMAMTGSANYTQNGFGENQVEAMTATDPEIAKKLYDQLLPSSSACTDNKINQKITIAEPSINQTITTAERNQYRDFDDSQRARLPLLTAHNHVVHSKAGLNWGQRGARDRNQAYIPIHKRIRDRDFFPPRAEQFTVLTDDGESFIMAVAQDDGKALHSTESNALLGLYFRNRMGLQSGEKITKDHLRQYGRMTVDFYRIEPGTYLMDFSPHPRWSEPEHLWT